MVTTQLAPAPPPNWRHRPAPIGATRGALWRHRPAPIGATGGPYGAVCGGFRSSGNRHKRPSRRATRDALENFGMIYFQGGIAVGTGRCVRRMSPGRVPVKFRPGLPAPVFDESQAENCCIIMKSQSALDRRRAAACRKSAAKYALALRPIFRAHHPY